MRVHVVVDRLGAMRVLDETLDGVGDEGVGEHLGDGGEVVRHDVGVAAQVVVSQGWQYKIKKRYLNSPHPRDPGTDCLLRGLDAGVLHRDVEEDAGRHHRPERPVEQVERGVGHLLCSEVQGAGAGQLPGRWSGSTRRPGSIRSGLEPALDIEVSNK